MKITTAKNLKLNNTELEKVNEVLELSEGEIMAMRKQFSSAYRISDKTIIIKDWLDDSIQIVKIR